MVFQLDKLVLEWTRRHHDLSREKIIAGATVSSIISKDHSLHHIDLKLETAMAVNCSPLLTLLSHSLNVE
jgi:hypothetical protein